MATELARFKKWASNLSKNDTLLAHFYIEQKLQKKEGKFLVKRIIDPPEYFTFNMLSKDKCWQVKGTSGHGMCGTKFSVPVLNCWKVDNEFYDALRVYYRGQNKFTKYKCAVILSKNKLETIFDDIAEVSFFKGEKLSSKNCWHFDQPKFKPGTIAPFHYCKIIRIKIPKEPITGEPIVRIPASAVLGIMVQYGNKQSYRNLLNQKGMAHVRLFSL